MCCNSKSPVGLIAMVLVVVGGLNWGLMAIEPSWNVVNMLLGNWPVVERVVYGLVGLGAVWTLVGMFGGCGDKCECPTK